MEKNQFFGVENVNRVFYRYYKPYNLNFGECKIMPYLPNFESRATSLDLATPEICQNLMVLGNSDEYAYPDSKRRQIILHIQSTDARISYVFGQSRDQEVSSTNFKFSIAQPDFNDKV